VCKQQLVLLQYNQVLKNFGFKGQLNVSGSLEVLYLDVIGVLQFSLWGCIAYSCITLDHPELAVSQCTSRLSAGNLMHVQQQLDFTGVNSDAKQMLLWEVEQLVLETAFLEKFQCYICQPWIRAWLAFPGAPEASACTPWGGHKQLVVVTSGFLLAGTMDLL